MNIASGAAARLAACTTEVDKWCLVQAKDLELLEEASLPMFAMAFLADQVFDYFF